MARHSSDMAPDDIATRLQEIKQELAQSCATDSEFRAAFLADPRGTVEAEYGLEPGSLKDLTIDPVVEKTNCIVVPIPPDINELELTDEQLDQVAGGRFFWNPMPVLPPIHTSPGGPIRPTARRGW